MYERLQIDQLFMMKACDLVLGDAVVSGKAPGQKILRSWA